MPEIPARSVTGLADEVAAGSVLLLDVREPEEWQAGHAQQATHIPMNQVPARAAELPRSRPIAVICAVGGRSAQVTAYLNGQGMQAVNVDGGMQAWQAHGYPVQQESEPGADEHPEG